MNTYKCECGNEATFVAGIDIFDSRFEQFHCDKCHRTFTTRNGHYIREGTLPEPMIYDTPTGSIYDYDDY